MSTHKLKLFTGNANRQLGEEIAEYLGISLGQAKVKRFADGESAIEINESVREADVFIIQPTCAPVNDNLMELLIMMDACRRASAQRITAVMPYYGYARQERKTKARDPISAKLVANLLTEAGADRVIAMDLHANAIQGFFDIPVDHLPAVPMLADYYKSMDTKDPVGSQQSRDHERHRQYQGQAGHHGGRHDRHRRHHLQGCQGPEGYGRH